MARKSYYLPFIPEAEINYSYLLPLLNVANYRLATKAYDSIDYISLKALSADTGISYSSLNRVLKDDRYKDFLSHDTKNKKIVLNCSFPIGKKQPFVKLNDIEYNYLISKGDNLLIKYYLYIKYYCGYTKNNTDFTANQFLSACGYSTKSTSYKEKLSGYNKELVSAGFISIEKYRDALGNQRNRYSIIKSSDSEIL